MATSTSPCKPTSDSLHPTQTPKRSSSDSCIHQIVCAERLQGPKHVNNNIALAHQDFRKKKQANRKFGTRDEYPGDIIPINAGIAIPGDISRIAPVLANIGTDGGNSAIVWIWPSGYNWGEHATASLRLRRAT
ncbi:hypothetical protein VDGE_30621 [Verticillium dahliae]|uniref:Uncharacterized protein n=1 Tax=Verticillium dahliae TaxID=27337 RepID=A0A444RVR3_VERDA|nr:hypothetical protein VDGE_30621 [Verticillium dahliae]